MSRPNVHEWSMKMNSSGPALVKDFDLWTEDTGVKLLVLQAENLIFRIPCDTLEEQSSVFKAMLEFPKLIPEDTFEGFPLIRLPDAASELKCFLKAVLKVEGYFKPPPAPTDLRTFLAILGLAHKYDVQHLRQRALRHVANAYPTTLQGWDNRRNTRTFPQTLVFDDEFELLRAALETDARWAMPALFYSCGAYPMREILQSSSWIGAGELLIEKNLCLQGYVDQFAATLRVLKFLVQPMAHGCLTLERCSASRYTWFNMVETWRPSIPLDIWDQGDWGRFAKDVCPLCLEQAKSVHRKARAGVWESLPKTYGLPSWEDLEAQKKRALR